MIQVTIIIGSESDRKYIKTLEKDLEELNISFKTHVFSTHRNIESLLKFLMQNKTSIYVTAAGLSAALPGIVSSKVKEPVIGVPLKVGELKGFDAFLSILQVPTGAPVATTGIGKPGLKNAVLFIKRFFQLT